jgi:hypothetical protein
MPNLPQDFSTHAATLHATEHVNPPSSVSSAVRLHNPATSVPGVLVHCYERRTVPQPEVAGFGPLVAEVDQAVSGLLSVM